jgi:gliding motility-associated-like protein
MRIVHIAALLLCLGAGLKAQPINDECVTAFHLSNTDTWCSAAGQYTNVNATPFTGPAPTNPCFLDLENEVWFTFIPQTPAIYVRITGAAFGLGTLRNPAVAIFEGPCSSLNRIGCNIVSSSTNQVELSVESLVIGRVYYLLVEGQNQNTGTFQICIEGFIPPPNPESDCSDAVVLCDKSPFVVDTLLGTGIQDPGVTNTCVAQELSSAWYKWTCETSGTLTFTITPNNYQPGFESDDIDFVVYELPNGIDNCSNKIMLRCMASGANTNEPFQNWRRCNGPTGLEIGDPDITEPAGCQLASQDSYVAAIDMVAGTSYALLINNFSQSGLGFSIDWGGTGTFQGPEPSFDVEAVQAFECDKTIIFTNESNAPTDSIVSYFWNFGAGANPTFDTTTGPISVIYESFGPKKVALTVTSFRGCVVTEIIDFYVEPCCADTSTLDLTATIQDQICPGTASGFIQAFGISGAPDYQYSLDCINYQPASVFPFLMPGTYTVCIQDEKGCKNQIDVEVLPAGPFVVEAGDTIFVELGDEAEVLAVHTPGQLGSVQWNNEENMTFPGNTLQDKLNPSILPPATGWYEITVISDAGCIATDSVLIIVDPHKPIYIPNVITANQDDLNDRATVYGNKAAAAQGVIVFQIFDRWGNMLWENSNFDLNDPAQGWDGTSKGKPVNPGVYAYVAKVNFIDNIPLTFNGTITVIR